MNVFYAGGSFGRAWVKMFGEKDNDWAWQAIVGARAAISSQIDVGLKYRYFRTDMIEVSDEAIALAGNPDRFVVGTTAPVNVDRTTNALVVTDFEDRFT